MYEIKHAVGSMTTLDKAYQAIATTEGVSSWWTSAAGNTEVGSTFAATFSPTNICKLEVIELKPNEKVAWKVVGGSDEWMGTEMHFNLREDKGKVMIQFRHTGYKRDDGILPHCSTKWAVFLLSLKQLLDTGTGRAFPNDQQIN